MSYLDAVRLHFAGRFQADVSTVNNQTPYYDNANFKPEYQQPQTPTAANGLWNPDGGAAWRLVDCRVTRVCYADGTSTTDPRQDPVVGMRIADANKRVAGKLVDLDPEQQMVSEVWGLIVRLTDGTRDSFGGPYAVAAFADLWLRAMSPGRPRQQPLGAMYQSVLAPVEWGDDGGSRFLRELRGATKDDVLSIKWNVDGFDRDSKIPTFTLGRIVGTIGPSSADEPRHLVIGRHLGGTDMHMYFMPCVVDPAARTLTADFGNAIATVRPGTELMPIGTMSIGWLDQNGYNPIGRVPYLDAGWYDTTAGVQAFPLTADQLSALSGNLVAVAINGQPILTENPGGVYVRADQFVYRMSPGTTAEVQIYAMQYGELQDGAAIVVDYDPSQLQGGAGLPPVGTPKTALTGFDPKKPLIAKNGIATLTLEAHDPKNPRGYVDGQVYGVRPTAQSLVSSPPGTWVNSSEFISVLVWDAFEAPQPTWYGEMQPIFTQYGNLYPLMDKIVDLTDYDSVAAHASILSFVFSLPVHDPNSMPVTRDLSPAKREAILKWLNTPGPDGKPLKGTPPPPKEAAPAPESVEAAPQVQRNDLFAIKSGLADAFEES